MRLLTLLTATIVLGGVEIARAQQEGKPATSDVRAAEVGAADVRAAIERSLPFLEREGVAWMNEKNCASCHHVPFLLWSHNAARAHGIAVDGKKVDQWTRWTVNYSRSRRAWFK